MMSIIYFIWSILMLSLTYCYTIEELQHPLLFKYEICSYNGEPYEYIDDNNATIIYCLCRKEFSNLTSLNHQINGVNIQCSYERKRRFIVMFWAIFLPIGVDYLYLEKYGMFIILFLLSTFMIAGNCIVFAKGELARNKDKDDEFNKKRNWIVIFFYVFFIICLIIYVINIILHVTGVTKDNNGIETNDDLVEIFSYISSND